MPDQTAPTPVAHSEPHAFVTQHIEVLKLLMDWSKWLVTIDVGALALLKVRTDGQDWYAPAASALLISLIAASILVGAIPGITQRIGNPKMPDSKCVQLRGRDNVYDISYGGISVQCWSFVQHLAFIAAAAFITTAAVLK